jgi:hypothetical protein
MAEDNDFRRACIRLELLWPAAFYLISLGLHRTTLDRGPMRMCDGLDGPLQEGDWLRLTASPGTRSASLAKSMSEVHNIISSRQRRQFFSLRYSRKAIRSVGSGLQLLLLSSRIYLLFYCNLRFVDLACSRKLA